ncbi:MAG: alanine:cation symporter family protein [Bdellovibrio sp.]|nr:MAG: alanine:cation symporter family protein [Bdellovibrio sp.]
MGAGSASKKIRTSGGHVSVFLSHLVDILWGPTLLILLVGGGSLLFVYSRFLPFKGFGRALTLIRGKFHHKGEEKAEGQISHFQALMTAVAATVGLGNIGGVAVAITQGGAGAIFWMWVAALIGMNTKFFECTLSVMYRGHDYKGEPQGGPMYVILNTFPKRFHFLAYLFAAFGLIGTLVLFQVNQLTAFFVHQFPWARLLKQPFLSDDGVLWGVRIFIGFLCAVVVGGTLRGGIRRVGQVAARLVPFMCVFYVLCCLLILLTYHERVPEAFVSIFKKALNWEALWGGSLGAAFNEAFRMGVRRAAYSNEAGVGTAPMAHSNVKTNEPVSEGLVAMMGPFLDTIVVCTMTALVILTSLSPAERLGDSGVLMTVKAFEKTFSSFGVMFLGLSILLFALSTMIGYSSYCEKCWNFLFKGRWGMTESTFIGFYSLTLMLGAIASLNDVVNLLDSGFALMAYINMTVTLLLAPHVKRALVLYFKKYP